MENGVIVGGTIFEEEPTIEYLASKLGWQQSPALLETVCRSKQNSAGIRLQFYSYEKTWALSGNNSAVILNTIKTIGDVVELCRILEIPRN